MISSETIGYSSLHNQASDQVHYPDNEPVVAMDVTVVIPTYNGAERLPRVLEALRSQQQQQPFSWEVVVSDNNSIDDTALTIKQYQKTWSVSHPLRYCFAAEQGAAFARQRAVEVANGDLIAFLDDDNIPDPDWLENVFTFAAEHPQAGAFGSQIHGEFEGPVPDGFDQISCYLAIVERGSQPHLYNPKAKILPPAAGLVVRRAAWLKAVPKRLFLNHKGKEAGLASEDLEALIHIQKAGWDIWYNPDMVVTHQIPNSRLKKDYLVALFRCIGLSRYYIRLLGAKDWLCPFLVPAHIANDLRKLALHYIRHRHTLNLVQSCEREHLRSSAASPLFLLKKAYQDWQQNSIDSIRLPDHQVWLQRLTDAFEQDQFELYHQRVESIENIADRGQTSYELLLRLADHDLTANLTSLMAPGQFLPTAERYGLTRTIDRWVIRRFFQMMNQPEPGMLSRGNHQHALFSLNLSTASVCDPQLPTFLSGQFRHSNLQPKLVCFEIQEATVLAHPQETLALVNFLHRIGCQIAIDDVSLKLAPVTLFQDLSIKYLKLNRQLINTPIRNMTALRAIEQLISQAHNFGLETIAKGVETSELLNYSKQVGVHYAQGYQIAKPVPFRGLSTFR